MPQKKIVSVSSSTMWTNTWKIVLDVKYRNFFIGSLILFFVLFSYLYGLWKIPFVDFGIQRMSAVTVWDYLFLVVVSLLMAVLLTLGKYERVTHLQSESKYLGKGSGAFAGLVAAACPVCQGIVIAALGTTLLTIPLGFLVPYLNFMKVASLALLSLAVFFRADGICTKTCRPLPFAKASRKQRSSRFFESRLTLMLLVAAVALVALNQFLLPQAYALTMVGGGGGTVGAFTYGAKTTLKPMPLAQGEQPAIAGYRSKVKALPTISELAMVPSSGDAVQDLINNVVPRGTPWYGAEAGVSFDDPITAQKLWGKGEAIQLDSAQEERYNRIVNSFTCDYCCGSPQNPTIITRCGCAHAKAARGMARWFISTYGDRFSDEEIYGEMARWYALWYPQGTIQRILQESGAA